MVRITANLTHVTDCNFCDGQIVCVRVRTLRQTRSKEFEKPAQSPKPAWAYRMRASDAYTLPTHGRLLIDTFHRQAKSTDRADRKAGLWKLNFNSSTPHAHSREATGEQTHSHRYSARSRFGAYFQTNPPRVGESSIAPVNRMPAGNQGPFG